MKIVLAVLIITGFMNVALSKEPKTVVGSIGINFNWDTSAVIATAGDELTQAAMQEISGAEGSHYRFFVQSPSETSFFQTVVNIVDDEEITTFVEL